MKTIRMARPLSLNTGVFQSSIVANRAGTSFWEDKRTAQFSRLTRRDRPPLRIEYPGALYHVTSRGDWHEPIFDDDQDRARFLNILGLVVSRYRRRCLLTI